MPNPRPVPDQPEWWRLAVAVVAVGVVSAVAGVALLLVMRLVQHLTFGYWHGSFLHGVEHSRPWRRVAAMAIGGVVVGLGWWRHHRRVDKEDVSVTRALRDPLARLPLVPTLADAALQIVGVGAGASVGREGAARQAAAACGGWVGERLQMSPKDRHILIACGAGAGLAAIYNVPLGGMLYTLEVLLAFKSRRAIIPAAVTSGIATVLCWPVLTSAPTYHVAALSFSPSVMVWALLLGPVAGLVGVGFMRLMTAARQHTPPGPWVIVGTTLSFAALGTVGMAMPELLGNGKSMAQYILLGGISIGLAALFTIVKPLVTAMCFAGGSIGGLLTPSFSTGAALGLFGGLVWSRLWPGAPTMAFVVVGAATLLSVTQRAPLTSIALGIEFTHTGLALLPAMIVAVTLAMLTAWLLDRRMAPIALAAYRGCWDTVGHGLRRAVGDTQLG